MYCIHDKKICVLMDIIIIDFGAKNIVMWSLSGQSETKMRSGAGSALQPPGEIHPRDLQCSVGVSWWLLAPRSVVIIMADLWLWWLGPSILFTHRPLQPFSHMTPPKPHRPANIHTTFFLNYGFSTKFKYFVQSSSERGARLQQKY